MKLKTWNLKLITHSFLIILWASSFKLQDKKMTLEQISYLILLIISLLAIVLTFGVVWRVERKLDISYKFILIAIIFFTCGIVFDVFRVFYLPVNFQGLNFIIKSLFIIFYTVGVYKMRSLIHEINEEVLKKDKPSSSQQNGGEG